MFDCIKRPEYKMRFDDKNKNAVLVHLNGVLVNMFAIPVSGRFCHTFNFNDVVTSINRLDLILVTGNDKYRMILHNGKVKDLIETSKQK